MNLNDRVAEALKDNKSWFPELALDLRHHTLGLAGEAGEVANEVKKWDRGDYGVIEESDSVDAILFRKRIAAELADVLVYTFSIAGMLGIKLDEVYTEKREFNEERFGNGNPG
jgi:NTP pyrophosphatase (non-canonical NTP hydrolase)